MSKAVVVWFAILAIAFANGALRELVLVPRLGAVLAGHTSVALLSLAIAAVTWFTIGWLKPAGPREALWIGAAWVLLTLVFEFAAGHYLFGKPWPTLLADYRVWEGRSWIVVLVTTLLAPIGAWYARLVSVGG